MLGFIRRNLRINSKSIKAQAYTMLARPKLEYASPVWDPYKIEHINNLERVQRRAARIVSNRHRNTSSVGEMLADLDWQTLEKRRKDARLVLLYKMLEGKVSIRCPELKPATTSSRSRRASVAHSRQLERSTCKKDLRLNSFLPHTIRDWNNLPSHVVHATCSDDFRREVSGLV